MERSHSAIIVSLVHLTFAAFPCWPGVQLAWLSRSVLMAADPLGHLTQRYVYLNNIGDLRPMVRIVAVVLIVAPILDVYVLDGRYTQTAGRILYSAFQHFR